MTAMTGSPLPRTGRVHPFVVAKVASEDRKGFVRNYLSAHTGVSLKAVLCYIAFISLFVIGLVLLG